MPAQRPFFQLAFCLDIQPLPILELPGEFLVPSCPPGTCTMFNRQLSTLSRYSRDAPSAWLPTSSTTAHLKDTPNRLPTAGKLRHEPTLRQKDKWGLKSFGSTSQTWTLLGSLRPSPAPRSNLLGETDAQIISSH